MIALEIIQLVCAVCTAIVAILGFKATLQSLQVTRDVTTADFERRRKRTTVEFYNRVSREFQTSVDLILKEFPKGEVLNESDVKNSKEMRERVATYLSYMEDISVGLNDGVYDFEIFERLAGKETLEWYDKLKPVLNLVGAKYDLGGENTTMYADYKQLVSKLIKKKYGIISDGEVKLMDSDDGGDGDD